MTLEEVQQAYQALTARGITPSVASLRAELGYGSYRDISRYWRMLRDGVGSEEPSIDETVEDDIPLAVKRVEIMGDDVTMWRDERTGVVVVDCRGRCEFLGIDWPSQYTKLTKSLFFPNT
jgi:hypothetical protein